VAFLTDLASVVPWHKLPMELKDSSADSCVVGSCLEREHSFAVGMSQEEERSSAAAMVAAVNRLQHNKLTEVI